MDFSHVCGAFDGGGEQQALPEEPVEGADRPVDCFRPADTDGLRFRSRSRARRSRQGRRAGWASGRHAGAVRPDQGRGDEHLDDDQRSGGLAAVALCRAGGRAGLRSQEAAGHHAERHRQGVPLARHLCVPAEALYAADRGHGGVVLYRDAEMESAERLLVPPPGGRGDAGSGAGVLAGVRHRRARRRA